MAELLMGREWPEEGSLASALRDGLPEGYFVVPDVTVHGQPLDAVLVGPPGLFALLVGASAPSAEEALRAFLRDEFPRLRPAIYTLLLLPGAESTLPATTPSHRGGRPSAATMVSREDLLAKIAGSAAPAGGPLADDDLRYQVALALRERQLTSSQRAQVPFVFRSGGLFGSGKKVWTIRAAVQHMARHPEDGVYHLRNGTLAQWLLEQGAEHLAALARDKGLRPESDPRIALEAFLLGTGLVPRPRLNVRPKRLHLGYALPGEAGYGRLRVQKGRGRGYLYGAVHAPEPWLHVEPHALNGKPLQAVVSAATETLPISQAPWQAHLLVESSASAEPLAVPVRVRVVGMPSHVNRWAVRPLIGALCAGLLGAAVGWALGAWGLAVPGWLAGLLPSVASLRAPIAALVFWAAVAGLFWAVLGAIRGLAQRPAWPVSYATARWLLRTLLWGAALALLAAAAYGLWRQLGPSAAAGNAAPRLGVVVLSALALAVLPSTWAEIRAGRRPRALQPLPSGRWRFVRRPVLLAGLGVLLILAVVLGLPLLARAWPRAEVEQTLSSGRSWAVEHWAQLEAQIGEWIDGLLLRALEQQRPVAPTTVPTPTSQARAYDGCLVC